MGVVAINLAAISLVESHIGVFFKSSDRLSRCVVAGGTWSLCGSPEMPLIPFLSPLPSLSAFIRLQSHTSRRQAWFMALMCVSVVSACAFSVGCGLVMILWPDILLFFFTFLPHVKWNYCSFRAISSFLFLSYSVPGNVMSPFLLGFSRSRSTKHITLPLCYYLQTQRCKMTTDTSLSILNIFI